MAQATEDLLQRLSKVPDLAAPYVSTPPEPTDPPEIAQESIHAAYDSPPSDAERHLADSVAQMAMISGWDNAIKKHSVENGIKEAQMRRILDEAADYNEKADPSGRIPELRDWKLEKRGRSERARPRVYG